MAGSTGRPTSQRQTRQTHHHCSSDGSRSQKLGKQSSHKIKFVGKESISKTTGYFTRVCCMPQLHAPTCRVLHTYTTFPLEHPLACLNTVEAKKLEHGPPPRVECIAKRSNKYYSSCMLVSIYREVQYVRIERSFHFRNSGPFSAALTGSAQHFGAGRFCTSNTQHAAECLKDLL